MIDTSSIRYWVAGLYLYGGRIANDSRRNRFGEHGRVIESHHFLQGACSVRVRKFLRRVSPFFILLAVVACVQSRTATTTLEATRSFRETEMATSQQVPPTRQGSPSLSPPAAIVAATSGPSHYPDGVNPLTGLTVTSRESLERMPLLIKVANFPRAVRPQWGLSLADLVFEHYTEEGTTRFSALFFGSDADRVGSICEASFIDLEFVRMYNAVFAFGSASHEVWDRINNSEVTEWMLSEHPVGCPPMCRYDAMGLNSLVTNTKDLQAYFEDLSLARERVPLTGMTFDMQAPEGGELANVLDVRYSMEISAQWTFDSGSGLYLRAQETGADQVEVEPLMDALTGQLVKAANVIVLFVPHEYYLADPEMLEIRLIGRGPALVFRDRQAYLITWERINLYRGLTFETDNGQAFPLKPGKSWIEFVGSTSLIERSTDDAWSVRFHIP
jgi:hypothetical protein